MNARFPDLPSRIKSLPVDQRGFPVPWFVEWIDGEPDFRVISHQRLGLAIKKRLCWICGQRLVTVQAFAIGPMCVINRVTSEPPAHLECARFAAFACPFLSKPKMRRNDKDMPDNVAPGGYMDEGNPGGVAIYVTPRFKPFHALHGNAGLLFDLGAPSSVEWWKEGRRATYDEARDMLERGGAKLRKAAEKDGETALFEWAAMFDRALPTLPAKESQ